MKRLLSIVCSLCIVLSAAAQSKVNQRYSDYIDTYKDLAIEQMLKHNIPASITLAQGLLESAAGYSELARKGNNHFGIKCHGWKGRSMNVDDDALGECFRVYDNPRQSYEDHSTFLRNGQRYAFLFSYQRTDYRRWAYGLKKAGYATNPQYASSLISIIERYDLAQYDHATTYSRFVVRHEPKAGTAATIDYHPIHMANSRYYVVARDGDTFRTIADELGLSYRKLARYNERDKNDRLQKGDIVYLEKKRRHADKSFKGTPHIVKAGESLYTISQKYGIRLKYLYKMNSLDADYVVSEGDQLRVY